MHGVRRLLGLAVVLWAVMSVPLGPVSGDVADAAGPAPILHTVSPRPGEVTAAGATLVQARVRSADPVGSVQLTVAGVPVEPVQVSQRDPPIQPGPSICGGKVQAGPGSPRGRLSRLRKDGSALQINAARPV